MSCTRVAFNLFLCVFLLCINFFLKGQSVDPLPKKIIRFCVIHSISLSGNKRTKQKIIFRELTFHEGDTIAIEELDFRLLRSKQNLLNTSLFNFVTVDTIPFFNEQIDIHIDVTERWYIFPIPIFEIAERNFNTWWETKDLKRASYGMYLTDENFRGLKQSLTLKVRLGYGEQYGLSYSIPYINKKQKSGLSFSTSYSRNHEIPFLTYGNQLKYYKNIHYYVRQEIAGRISYSYRSGLYDTHFAELRYIKGILADTILNLTPDYFPAGETSTQFFTINYGYKHDYRDSKVYPLKGYYIGVDVSKVGLGILSGEKINVLQIQVLARKYIKLYDRVYVGSSIKFKLSSSQKQPYYVQRALGYGDYVRGYEYYVVDGQSYGLFKSNIHFQIVKPHTKSIPLFENDKFDKFHYAFYLGLYFDAAYVKDRFYYANNPITNQWMAGYGASLDFVTYYDTVVRFEYSRNKLNENIFTIRLGAPL